MKQAPPRRLGRSDASIVTLDPIVAIILMLFITSIVGFFIWHSVSSSTDSLVGQILLTLLAMFVVSCLATFGIVLVQRWRRRRQTPKGLATKVEIKSLAGTEQARKKAEYQRPSMTPEQIAAAPVEELALPLGRSDDGTVIYAPMEAQVAVVGPTGAGKGAFFVVPAALSAPGPVVVTTTRADVLNILAGPRGAVGRVWVFDPLDLASWPEPMVWDALAGCEDHRIARSRGRAFTAALSIGGERNGSFFKDAAGAALQYLMHAAALGGASMTDVAQWAMTMSNGAEKPQAIIRTSNHPQAEKLWADMLRSLATGADETVASTLMTLRSALDALSGGSVLSWLTPRDGTPTFDPRNFARSRDTLVLIMDANSSSNLAPLTTMLFQDVVDTAKEVARTMPHEMLDPPLRIVGDEIANIAPIENLPELSTDARGYGIQLITFWQARSQVYAKWGKERGEMLLTQASYEIVLPGLKDPDSLEMYSRLVGSVDIAESTISAVSDGTVQSRSFSVREQRILRPEEIRKLEPNSALLIIASKESLILRLTPWWERPDGPELSAGAERMAIHRAGTAAAAREKRAALLDRAHA